MILAAQALGRDAELVSVSVDGAAHNGPLYRTYRDGNALTEDFRRVLELRHGQPLDWFFRQWIYEPGFPAYDAALSRYSPYWVGLLLYQERQLRFKQLGKFLARENLALLLRIISNAIAPFSGSHPLSRRTVVACRSERAVADVEEHLQELAYPLPLHRGASGVREVIG